MNNMNFIERRATTIYKTEVRKPNIRKRNIIGAKSLQIMLKFGCSSLLHV
jgi:hypothetical protein